MLLIVGDLERISMKTQKELESVENELQQLPSGRLLCERQGKRIRFVKATYDGHKRKRRNLSSGDSELRSLLKKRILEAEKVVLAKNCMYLKRMLKDIKDFDLAYTLYDLKTKLPALDDGLISEALAKNDRDGWGNMPYESLVLQDGNTRWHITSFGLKVRSKSELMIAEMLHKHHIQFRYEQLIRFEGSFLAPDFTIKREDGKIIYWEHEGLTNSEIYLSRQLKKSQIYAMNKIVPWDNLIITYDNADGMIDMRIVEAEITNRLLIN